MGRNNDVGRCCEVDTVNLKLTVYYIGQHFEMAIMASYLHLKRPV